jgi:hypothetical protein
MTKRRATPGQASGVRRMMRAVTVEGAAWPDGHADNGKKDLTKNVVRRKPLTLLLIQPVQNYGANFSPLRAKRFL